MRFTHVPAIAATLSLVLVACSDRGNVEPPAPAGSPNLVRWPYDQPPPYIPAQGRAADGVIRFVAVGDFGTGSEDQYKVAGAIETVCRQRGCDFALALGDNIYESGVAAADDPQFEDKFEKPYAKLNFPWFVSLGNHDNSMDPLTEAGLPVDQGLGHWYASGNHQVAYAKRTDRTSNKWTMAGRYYNFTVGGAEFFALDTNTLMYFGLGFPPIDYELQGHEQWIDAALTASTARWKIAFGHHPYISNGEHGDAGNYEAHYYESVTGSQHVPHPAAGLYVKTFLEQHVCDKVDLYITGHDHDLQWHGPVESCGRTEFLISGAAAKTRALANAERHPAYFQQGETLGFAWIEIAGDRLTGAFFDGDGKRLFERSVTQP